MAVLVPGTTTVARLIEAATTRGCEHRKPQMRIVSADGDVHVRYLFNPSNNGRFMLSEYDDDELISPDVWDAAERRLGIALREH